jgi:hypothetical protein
MMHGHDESLALWHAFFLAPYLSRQLMRDLRPAFLSMIGQWGQADMVRTTNQMFGVALLYYPTLLSEEEIGEFMRRASGKDLRHLGWFLADKMKNDADLWRKRVLPILKKIWPSSIPKTNKDSVNGLIKITLQTNQDFPSAIAVITRRALLGPIEDCSLAFSLLGSSKYVTIFPQDVLVVLDAIVPTELPPYDASPLRETLDDIGIANPALIQDPHMIALRRRTPGQG